MQYAENSPCSFPSEHPAGYHYLKSKTKLVNPIPNPDPDPNPKLTSYRAPPSKKYPS